MRRFIWADFTIAEIIPPSRRYYRLSRCPYYQGVWHAIRGAARDDRLAVIG